jgi:hypothetical protein
MGTTLLAVASVIGIAVATHYCTSAKSASVAEKAPEVEILDASKIKLVNFDVKFTPKNGEAIGTYKTSVLVDETNKYQAVDERAYISSVVNNNGVLTINPGMVTTGLEVELTPKFVSDENSVIFAFDASYKKLNEMKSIKQGDISVEWPDLTQVRMSQTVNLKKGETLEVNSIGNVEGSDKYVLTIKAY